MSAICKEAKLQHHHWEHTLAQPLMPPAPNCASEGGLNTDYNTQEVLPDDNSTPQTASTPSMQDTTSTRAVRRVGSTEHQEQPSRICPSTCGLSWGALGNLKALTERVFVPVEKNNHSYN